MVVGFIIPIRTVSVTNAREHWAVRKRRVDAERKATAMFMRLSNVAVPALPLAVELTRIAPRALDTDNLHGSLKSIRDQLAVELGLKADNDPQVTWTCAQRQGRAREYAVEVRFESR